MIWTLSDGSTVRLGGEVSGPPVLRRKAHFALRSWLYTPAGSRRLDPSDLADCDLGVRTLARILRLSVVAAPSLPRPDTVAATEPYDPAVAY